MTNVKTAISVPAELFNEVERYSRKNKMPRSHVFAEGARRLLREQEGHEITDRLNEIYSDPALRKEEAAFARAASASLARTMRRRKW